MGMKSVISSVSTPRQHCRVSKPSHTFSPPSWPTLHPRPYPTRPYTSFFALFHGGPRPKQAIPTSSSSFICNTAMVESGVEKIPQAVEGKPQFKSTKSAAEMAMMEAEGYADEGLAEHKGGKHLEEYWHKGYGGLRADGEDLSDEEARLHELKEHRCTKQVSRARGANVAVDSEPSPKVSQFKSTKSAAELAYDNAEGYADEGLAEHKGGKHLEAYWHKGYGGLRAEGEDLSDEEARLRELEEHAAGGRSGAGMVQRTKEAVASTAAAATEKAGELLQAAKEMVGLEPKK